MDKPKATPKDFFLWAGAMVSLYAGVVAFISLLFEYINQTFKDTSLNYYYDPYASGVAYSMASLIVLAPTFLILMRFIRRNIERDPSRGEVWVRRWALFLTVFIAGATIVIDLIVLLNTFLSGEELTARFLLKVLVVLLVAGAGFMHFLADIWGYWVKNPAYARYINWATGVLIVLAVAAGFLIIGSPQNQRALRLDQQRLNDLQSLQSQIINFYQQKERLPQTLAELNDPLSYYTVPVDPQTKQPYDYSVKGALQFEVCADFTTEGGVDPYGPRSVAMPVAYGVSESKWEHKAERTCFTRTIDPELYPPYPKPVR
jgi:hypothetical protein